MNRVDIAPISTTLRNKIISSSHEIENSRIPSRDVNSMSAAYRPSAHHSHGHKIEKPDTLPPQPCLLVQPAEQYTILRHPPDDSVNAINSIVIGTPSHNIPSQRHQASSEKKTKPSSKIVAHPTDASFVQCLAVVLDRLIAYGATRPPTSGPEGITRFHAFRAPDVNISAYLARIQKYFCCSNECFVLALIYIDRVVKFHDSLQVSSLNVHRLTLTSVMLAAKFFDDVYYANAFYAKVGGVKTSEINILEAHFLMLIDYRLYVSMEEYEKYRSRVMTAVGCQIAKGRLKLSNPKEVSQSTHNKQRPDQSDGQFDSKTNDDLSGSPPDEISDTTSATNLRLSNKIPSSKSSHCQDYGSPSASTTSSTPKSSARGLHDICSRKSSIDESRF